LYDLIWFIARAVPVRLAHLNSRLVQADAWKTSEELTALKIIELLSNHIDTLNVDVARADVI
jgi:hypothetical protein